MPRSCSVCGHTQRAAIDRALVNGEPLRDIAGRFGVAKSSLDRHKADHLPATMVKAKETEDVAHAIDIVQQLKTINGVALHILKDARDARNGDLALKAIDRIERQIALQAKLIGELDERPVVNVLIAPEWLAVRSAMLDALRAFPEARIAVADRLAAIEAGHDRG